jgi:hypothetical protein
VGWENNLKIDFKETGYIDWGGRVNGTGFGLCQMAGFDISSVEPAGLAGVKIV